MPVSKDPDDKHKPPDRDDDEHSDSNELPDENNKDYDDDQTAISHCSSENRSSRQSLSDVDSGNYSDRSSKTSTLNDVTTSNLSVENENTSDSDLSNDLFDSLTSNYSDYDAFDSSNVTSLHSSIKNGTQSVSKKGSGVLRSDDEKNSEENFFDSLLSEKVHQLKREGNKEMERLIRSPERNGKESTSVDNVKEFSTHLSKQLRNTDFIDDAGHAENTEDLSLVSEKFKFLQKYRAKYLIEKLEEELIKLAGANKGSDSIAALKGYLKHLKSKLATGHVDDDHLADAGKYLPEMLSSMGSNAALDTLINDSISNKEKIAGDSSLARFKTIAVRGNNHQINDGRYLEYLRKSSIGKVEKSYSEIEDCKQFQNGMALNAQDTVVMYNLDGE